MNAILVKDDLSEILKQRARELARSPEAERSDADCIKVVEFALGSEIYGIELEYLNEIYPLKDLTPLPCAPSFVVGIINVRSEILPVIDLKKIFDLPPTESSDLQKVIVVHAAGMILGILADAIVGVQSLPRVAIQPSLPTITGINAEYLRGITPQQLIVLNLEKILSNEQLLVYEEP
jgi:purine-binding chemotaxis protein CheW